MTRQIPQEEWKEFFDELSQERLNRETVIEVLNDGTDAQVMSKRLPFAGLTYEEKNGQKMIELITGNRLENHQSHTIFDPETVVFESEDERTKSTLNIEDKSGTKTLIVFIQQCAVIEIYSEFGLISTF